MIKTLLLKNRSYRRFDQSNLIPETDLKELIDLARFSPSPRNRQSLKFYISNTEEINKIIFPALKWAGALPNWNGPKEGEKPVAYIILLGDNSIRPKVDKHYHEVASGIVMQSILLGAVEKGYGGCIIAAVQRRILKNKLNIPEHLDLLYVLALGKPIENIIIDTMSDNGNYNYWRDENQNHHVPKRPLKEIIITEF